MTKKNLYYYSTPSVTQIFVLLHPSLANTVFDQCDYVIKSRKREKNWLLCYGSFEQACFLTPATQP